MTPKICIGWNLPLRHWLGPGSLLDLKITVFSSKKFPVLFSRETPNNSLNTRGDFRRDRRWIGKNIGNSLLFSLFAGNFAETG